MSSQASFIQDGQQVLASDLNSLASSAAVSSGAALAALVGASDANANDSPLTVVPGNGLTVVVGGAGQKVLVQARLADYIPAQTLAFAAANSTDRIDLIAFQYADVIVSTGGTASFLDAQGNLGPQPTSYVYRGIRLTVVTGVPGAGTPAAPAGFGPAINTAFIEGFIRATRRRDAEAVLGLLVHDKSLISKAMVEDVLRYKRLDGATDALRTIARAWFADGQQRVAVAAPRLPVQLIWGENDQIIPVSDAAGTVTHRLEAAGHLPHMEKASEVNRLIRRFIAG